MPLEKQMLRRLHERQQTRDVFPIHDGLLKVVEEVSNLVLGVLDGVASVPCHQRLPVLRLSKCRAGNRQLCCLVESLGARPLLEHGRNNVPLWDRSGLWLTFVHPVEVGE